MLHGREASAKCKDSGCVGDGMLMLVTLGEGAEEEDTGWCQGTGERSEK